MNHLKPYHKFNESETPKFKGFDPGYLDMVFAEFLDNPKTYRKCNTEEWTYLINAKEPLFQWIGTSIDSEIDYHTRLNDFYRDIKVCVGRVLDEYPELGYTFRTNRADYSITLLFNFEHYLTDETDGGDRSNDNMNFY